MSPTITLEKPLVSSVPVSMQRLIVELDRADTAPPEQLEEINVLEMLYQRPFIERESPAEATNSLPEIASEGVRELAAALVTFAVDVSCQIVAIAAAMPFVPSFIGKPIYRPLVRRILS